MAVIVETYEIEEAVTPTGSTPEIEAEALGLIEKLGLKGQTSLVAKPEKPEATGHRVPYPEMTAQERAVYAALFPQHTPVDRYAAGVIPLRVLQVVALCREANFFKRLEIWHKQVRDPDPILVGYLAPEPGQWRDREFLLARWGDALKTFPELVKEAREALSAKFEAACSEAAIRIRALADGGWRGLVEKKLAGEFVNVSGPEL